MQTQSDFNFEDFKKEAIKGMYAGKPLNGEKGIFAPPSKTFYKLLFKVRWILTYKNPSNKASLIAAMARQLNG